MSNGAVDWPGLLKWSLKYTDSTTCKNLKPLSKEDAEFIEKALKEATGTTLDPSKLIEEAVQKFNNDSLTENDKVSALVTIRDCVDDFPEISRQLDSLQVLPILLKAIQMNHEEIRNVAYQILSFALSNNEKIQIEFWNAGGLIELLKDREALLTNPINFSALSSLIRQVKDIEQDFLKLGGYAIISCGIQSTNSKIQVKAANIFKHLAIDELCTVNEIFQAKIPESFAFMMKNISNTSDSIQCGESCCFAVQELLKCLTTFSPCETQQLDVKQRRAALELLKESMEYRYKNIDPHDASYTQEKDMLLILLDSLQEYNSTLKVEKL